MQYLNVSSSIISVRATATTTRASKNVNLLITNDNDIPHICTCHIAFVHYALLYYKVYAMYWILCSSRHTAHTTYREYNGVLHEIEYKYMHFTCFIAIVKLNTTMFEMKERKKIVYTIYWSRRRPCHVHERAQYMSVLKHMEYIYINIGHGTHTSRHLVNWLR